MKRVLLSGIVILFFSANAAAETWIAKLDGIQGASSAGLQFNFGTERGDPAIIYFKTANSTGQGGIFEIARGRVTSATDNEVMAAFHRGRGASGQPMTRITINRAAKTVNVLYHHPTDSGQNKKDVFGVVSSVLVVP